MLKKLPEEKEVIGFRVCSMPAPIALKKLPEGLEQSYYAIFLERTSNRLRLTEFADLHQYPVELRGSNPSEFTSLECWKITSMV